MSNESLSQITNEQNPLRALIQIHINPAWRMSEVEQIHKRGAARSKNKHWSSALYRV